MKLKTILLPILIAAGLLAAPATRAEDAKPDAKAQLETLIDKVRAKLGAGKPSAETLADELKEFETLLTQHQGEKTPEVAQILFMEAMLYQEVLANETKATELLERLQKDFPETPQAKQAARTIAAVKKQAELAVGKTFPDFAEKDLEGEPLSLGKYKGKVVLIDFWATWCGPCVAELPKVLEAYQKHHAAGFEIIGISLDKDRDKLTAFLKEKNMAWKQFFDGQGWQNKLAQDYGINSIPATYLVDRKGQIVGRDLRGNALEEAVAKALEKKD